jgi:glycosyltransferase involved in cell wall biosynthesis
MKVLFSHDIFVSQSHGGASRVFVGLHAALRARGVNSRIAAGLHVSNYLDGQTGVAGVRVPGTVPPALRRAFIMCNTPIERALVKAWRPSVYHLTYFPRRTAPPSAPVVVPVLDMIHELYSEQFPQEDRTAERKRHWVNAADLVFAISQRTKDDLVSMLSIPEDKVVAVYPGVGPLRPDPQFDVRPYGDYLLYVGERGIGYKNFDGFVRALAKSQVASSLNLVCFGGRPTTAGEQEMLAGLGLLGRTTMVNGGDAQLAALYAGARALVYPSRYEGFGFPPLEAMLLGCPVACSRAGSLSEVVGNAAILFDPDDIEEMAAALDRVVADESLRTELIAVGTARATGFSWDRSARDALEGYRRLEGLVTAPTDGGAS